MRAENRGLSAEEIGIFTKAGMGAKRIDDRERIISINKIIIAAALAFFYRYNA